MRTETMLRHLTSARLELGVLESTFRPDILSAQPLNGPFLVHRPAPRHYQLRSIDSGRAALSASMRATQITGTQSCPLSIASICSICLSIEAIHFSTATKTVFCASPAFLLTSTWNSSVSMFFAPDQFPDAII